MIINEKAIDAATLFEECSVAAMRARMAWLNPSLSACGGGDMEELSRHMQSSLWLYRLHKLHPDVDFLFAGCVMSMHMYVRRYMLMYMAL